MKINKRVFYALSSLLIFGYSVLSPFNSVFAQGSTPQIPDFRITKKLLLQYDKSSVDVSTLFYSYFFTRKDVEWPYSCSRFISRADAEKSYKKAVYGNGDWIVLNYYYGGNGHDERYVRLYWTESKAPKQILRYDEYYGYHFSEYGFKQLILTMPSSGHFRVVCDASLVGDDTPLVLSNSYSKPPGLVETFLSTPDYELSSILKDRNIKIPKSLQDEILPDFEYNVVDKKISIKHLKDRDRITLDAFSDYTKGGWRLVDNTYQLVFTVQKRRGGDVVHQRVINPGDSFSVDLPSYDEYTISAGYSARACYSYGEGSATPDYCINALPQDSEYVKYKQRYMYINVDGQKHSGSTVDSACLEGFCDEKRDKPKYEDCSQYDYNFNGLKIPSFGSIACAIRNSFVWFFTDFIFSIIFPKIEDLQLLWNDLLNTIIDRLGFLALPFTFIKGVFTTVEAMNSNNSTCAVSLTVFGSTANVELCRWRYQLPAVWSFMQTILQGGIAIGFLWTCYRLANRFFGIYVEDYEEEEDSTMTARWYDDRTGETGEWQKFRKDKD
jgi:hypothetical protein